MWKAEIRRNKEKKRCPCFVTLGKSKGNWGVGEGGGQYFHTFSSNLTFIFVLSVALQVSCQKSPVFLGEVCAMTYFVFIRIPIILWSGSHNGTYILLVLPLEMLKSSPQNHLLQQPNARTIVLLVLWNLYANLILHSTI